MLLLGKFEKFPEYLDIKIQKNPNFFDFLAPFSEASKFTIARLFSNTNKCALIDSFFPLKLRIFLVPKLNILTVELHSENYSTDQLLGNLFGVKDCGQ